MNRKRKVTNFLMAMREVVESTNTSDEVRNTANYTWMVLIANELINHGVPDNVAKQAAANMTTTFPPKFHKEFNEEFLELIKLMGHSLSMLYFTMEQDFGKLADTMFVTRVREEGGINIDI